MRLSSVRVMHFKSIENSGEVAIDPAITVFVGQNESGKTAFLQALNKAASVDEGASFNIYEDYPRRLLSDYEKCHETSPDKVVELTYQVDQNELEAINGFVGFQLCNELSFSHTHKYNNTYSVTISIPEKPYVDNRIRQAELAAEVRDEAFKVASIRELVGTLERLSLKAEDQAFLGELKQQFPPRFPWSNRLAQYVWQEFLRPNVPKFLYFDEYYLLPGKISLTDLQLRVQGHKPIRDEDKTALSLLRLAGVDLDALTETTGYEPIRARLEAISNAITDKIFNYWTQNKDLEVQFDIRPDPMDEPPFDQGNNLYIRIRNPRHRVTVPFSQRSKGFIWFFSFITWFDGIQQGQGSDADLILLLDEPGLSLHALAQNDFLRYIDDLARDHQILYTTHSPFMVDPGRLNQVRTVEDKQQGTKITSNISRSEPNTIFPLQAALGYSIAQNLFISKHNLLVEGPADLIYLRHFSTVLDGLGRTGLDDHITIVPVGGLDKLATFVALLRGNELDLAVLHDYDSKPDQHLGNLIKDKLIRDRQVLNYAMFRTASKTGGSVTSNLLSSDVEDLFQPSTYLAIFNAAYKQQLGGVALKASDLPAGSRIIQRIGQFLNDNRSQLRPSGGFNHYLVANHLAATAMKMPKSDTATLANFEAVFREVNRLLSAE